MFTKARWGKVYLSVLIALLLASFLMPFALAQDTRAALFGVVTDNTGAVVAGVTVSASATATGLKWTTTTDSAGRYRIQLLPSGSYTLTVEAAQFTRQTQADLTLRVGEERRVDVSLSAGQIAASV
ncbi:MAG: carboxypeptidase-like regulatory domain-containing protein, partial [Blastocatellia bacterium]